VAALLRRFEYGAGERAASLWVLQRAHGGGNRWRRRGDQWRVDELLAYGGMPMRGGETFVDVAE